MSIPKSKKQMLRKCAEIHVEFLSTVATAAVVAPEECVDFMKFHCFVVTCLINKDKTFSLEITNLIKSIENTLFEDIQDVFSFVQEFISEKCRSYKPKDGL